MKNLNSCHLWVNQNKFGLIKRSKTLSKLSLAMLFDSSSPVISHLTFVIYHLSLKGWFTNYTMHL